MSVSVAIFILAVFGIAAALTAGREPSRSRYERQIGERNAPQNNN